MKNNNCKKNYIKKIAFVLLLGIAKFSFSMEKQLNNANVVQDTSGQPVVVKPFGKRVVVYHANECCSAHVSSGQADEQQSKPKDHDGEQGGCCAVQ